MILPLRNVFEDPTVSGVSALVDRLRGGETTPSTAAATTAAPAKTTEPEPEMEHITVEFRPALTLFAAGKLQPVDAVALAYLPSSLLQHTGIPADVAIQMGTQDMPLVAGIQETSLGRIAGILLPRFDYQLYQDKQAIIDQSLDALRIAKHMGAKTISLTGLIPSATDYGRALVEAAAGLDLPTLTTGHATTTASVVLTIRNAVRSAGRELPQEHVAFLGLGSIGVSTLRLMLSVLPHPEQLSLCDIYSKRGDLEALGREIVDVFGFRGRITILESSKVAPDEIYRAGVVVGATNVADILDVAKLRPGTVIVDDSAPHCFRTDDAWKRLDEQGDLLFTEGGVLTAPAIIPQIAFIPAAITQIMQASPVAMLAQTHPRHITGCILSSVLTLTNPDLKATVGIVDVGESKRHFLKLLELGYEAGLMHCDGKLLDEAKIAAFRDRFGRRT